MLAGLIATSIPQTGSIATTAASVAATGAASASGG